MDEKRSTVNEVSRPSSGLREGDRRCLSTSGREGPRNIDPRNKQKTKTYLICGISLYSLPNPSSFSQNVYLLWLGPGLPSFPNNDQE